MTNGPIERKVVAATGGSTVGVAAAGLILWFLDTYVFRAEPVPDAITVAVVTLLPIGLTFVAGFVAHHTPRSDPKALVGEHRKVDRADLRAAVPPDIKAPDSGIRPRDAGYTALGLAALVVVVVLVVILLARLL